MNKTYFLAILRCVFITAIKIKRLIQEPHTFVKYTPKTKGEPSRKILSENVSFFLYVYKLDSMIFQAFFYA